MNSRLWRKRLFTAFMAFAVLLVQLFPVPYAASAAALDTGATYFTGTDNWGGGAANSAADGDVDSSTGNGTALYPIEFKN
ncbi:hypothetical protein MHH56_04355 [Paenibacillus sp. FSL K6-3182]|uniref:hypothetical protein n=1 Tax=Paenibacillus sp. FSL K6-3182 TaxID=2921495 RepID=UPI0030CFD7CF